LTLSLNSIFITVRKFPPPSPPGQALKVTCKFNYGFTEITTAKHYIAKNRKRELSVRYDEFTWLATFEEIKR